MLNTTTRFGFISMLVATMIVWLNLGTAIATAAAPPAPRAEASLSHSVVPHVANPHLHGATPAVVKSTAKKQIAKHWRGRWSFASWAVVHRGLGTISGQVFTASGSPASGVRVALRTAKGKPLGRVAARHITHTGVGGTFFMTNVRIGSYRVRATHAKAAGSSPIHVSGGAMAMVSVRI